MKKRTRFARRRSLPSASRFTSTLAQSRLERIEEFRSKPMDPQYDNGAYIDHLLDEYISITDELKNWIQDQYDRRGDMRKGLRKVLEMGPKQLDRVAANPGVA